jgi:hypothetical protein
MERPILFSAPMVRAIFDGRKTQTRRIVKLAGRTVDSRSDGTLYVARATRSPQETSFTVPCPYGAPGDRLWVRETFSMMNRERTLATTELYDQQPTDLEVVFRADEDHGHKAWHPSIFMPRWASRITLEVTGVRVERLHSITDDDARAEGCLGYPGAVDATPREEFEELWKHINGLESWRANPFVWVVSFKRLIPAQASQRAAFPEASHG